MPELFDLSDIEMTLNIFTNLHEVITTEIERRNIDVFTFSVESGISQPLLFDIKGSYVTSTTLKFALEWLIRSMKRPAKVGQ